MTVKNAKSVKVLGELIKILVVGDFGSGKSSFFSTFPSPGYVFDLDQHIEGYQGKDFNYSQYPFTPAGWVAFEKEFKVVEKDVKKGKYQTVILDSTTALIDLAMERALQLDPKREHNGPIWNVHYQIVKNLVAPKLRRFLTLPCNVLISAHLKVTTDSKTGAIIKIDPLLTGDLSEKIPGYFKEVYYSKANTVQGKTKFTLQTVTKGFFKARSLISGIERKLPDFIPNTYSDFLKAIKEGGVI
jgi:hypothetical protein